MRLSHFILVACLVVLCSMVFASMEDNLHMTTITAFGNEEYQHEGYTFSSQASSLQSGEYPPCDPEEDKFLYYGLSHEFQYGFEVKKIKVYGCNFSMGESFELEGIYLHDQLCTIDEQQDEGANYMKCTTSVNENIHGIGDIKFRFLAPGFGINFIIREQYSYHNPILHYVTPYALPQADDVTVRVALEDYYEHVSGYEYSISIGGVYATTVQQAQGYILASIDLLKNKDKYDGSGTVKLHLFDGRETEIDLASFGNAAAVYPIDDATDAPYVTSTEPAWLPLETEADDEAPFYLSVFGKNLIGISEMHIYNDATLETLVFYRKTTQMSDDEVEQLELEDELLYTPSPVDANNNTNEEELTMMHDEELRLATGSLLTAQPTNSMLFDFIEGEDGIVFEIPVIRGIPPGPVTVEFYSTVQTVHINADGLEEIVSETIQYETMTEITLIAQPEYVATLPSNAIHRGEDALVEYYIKNFPHHVPTAFSFATVDIINPGDFLYHREGYLYFNLPKCDDTTDCTDNFTGPVCLRSLNTPTCVVDLGEFTYLPKRTEPEKPMIVLATNQTKYFDEYKRYHIIYGFGLFDEENTRQYHSVRLIADTVNNDIIKSDNIELVPRTKNSFYMKLRTACHQLGACVAGNYTVALTDETDRTISVNGDINKIKIAMKYNPHEAVRVKFLMNLDHNEISKDEKLQKSLRSEIDLGLLFSLHDYVTQGISSRFVFEPEFISKGKDVTLTAEQYKMLHRQNGDGYDLFSLLTPQDSTNDDEPLMVTFPGTVVSVILAPPMYYEEQPYTERNANSTVLMNELRRQMKDAEKGDIYIEVPDMNTDLNNHVFENKLSYCQRKKTYTTEDECQASEIDYKIVAFIVIAGVLLAIVTIIVLYLIIQGRKKEQNDQANIQGVYTSLDN